MRFGISVLLAAAFSCGPANETPDQFISIGSAPPGGAFFIVGGALAEVLDQYGAWSVTSEGTKGSLESIRRLESGELEIALANSSITYFAVRGEAGWDRPYPMRSLVTMAPNVLLFITPRDSGIETIRDLAGKRIVAGPAGAGWEFFIRPMLAAHGLSVPSGDGGNPSPLGEEKVVVVWSRASLQARSAHENGPGSARGLDTEIS